MDRICTFRESVCHNCGNVGHLAKVCRSKGRGTRRRNKVLGLRGAKRSARWIDSGATDNKQLDDDVLCHIQVHTLGSGKVNPFKVVLEINGK